LLSGGRDVRLNRKLWGAMLSELRLMAAASPGDVQPRAMLALALNLAASEARSGAGEGAGADGDAETGSGAGSRSEVDPGGGAGEKDRTGAGGKTPKAGKRSDLESSDGSEARPGGWDGTGKAPIPGAGDALEAEARAAWEEAGRVQYTGEPGRTVVRGAFEYFRRLADRRPAMVRPGGERQ
ncbi:MAG: hypothetical protein N3A38_06800, partial [Planctomycetota bacterium]|nr:hypothetical protein [Planctomycetota bacterium]